MPTAATTDAKPMGRPRKDDKSTPFWAGPLHKMLAQKLPAEYVDERGIVETKKLADKVGFARFTIYNWMHRNRLTARAAKALIDMSDGRITRKDVTKFLMSES